MSVPNTRERAQAFVRQIAKDHGYLGEEKLSKIEPDLRREIEEAFLKKDLMIGDTVITLAKNLYTSKARARGDMPYVSFSIYPQKIVVECNEDGFTTENLTAICAVGKSSKKGTQGYIGEKGIGFKSVFMAAWKVHIQSGAFSFSFRHKTGESGMGMISPVWEDTNEELPSPKTKFTLHLHQIGDEAMLTKAREVILQQFEELQETVLLFMKNLKMVHVSFHNDCEDLTSTIELSIDRPESNRAVLRRTTNTGDSTEKSVKFFHVTTHQATGLPRNEQRTYSEAEEACRAFSKSQITLAFPLTESSVPIIKPQNLFVFLPVRAVGFNFLIQADFVTDASRQDIVKDSLRNVQLVDSVADAFVGAVLQFCCHSSLRYQWMRYLPDRNAAHWDGLWKSLVNSIAIRLGQTPVLYGRKKPELRLINDMLRLLTLYLDSDALPLLDDGEPEQIVSQHYTERDLELLRDYSLRNASLQELNSWLARDLQRGELSRMRDPRTSEDWHKRVATLFSLPFQNGWGSRMAELRLMDVLPLENGTWVSASSGPVYFAQVDGLDIPLDLNLRLISKAVANVSRQAFFRHLGVGTASASFVRLEILRRYRTHQSLPSLNDSRDHLRFLYLTEASKSDDEPSYSKLHIADSDEQFHRPCEERLYIVDKSPYGAWELFRKTDPGFADGAPGFSQVTFVNAKYFKDVPTKPSESHWTWNEWLHRKLKVRKVVSFHHQPETILHPGAAYLQKYRPEKFLGALRADYATDSALSEDFITCLRETEVMCQPHGNALLQKTYYPTKDLRARVERYVQPNSFFPWLWMDTDETPDAVPADWKPFLNSLGIGLPSSDLQFALDMLEYSLDSFYETVTETSRQRLFSLYKHIYLKLCDDADDAATTKTREFFATKPCIHIPGFDGNSCKWAFPSQCVWGACQDMQSKFTLERLYGSVLGKDATKHSSWFPLFQEVLGIKDCTLEDYTQELKVLKASGCSDSDIITGIYKALDAHRSSLVTVKEFADAFENDALVYVPSDDGPSWHKTSQCVWSSAARVLGKVSLNENYSDLEALFVDCIGVKRVDLDMAVAELKEAGDKPSASVLEIRDSIWTVNSLLPTTSTHPDPEIIVKSLIFPVKNFRSITERASIATPFFVVDREQLSEAFKAKVKLFDFTLDEVVRLRPFIEWTCLKPRFLSNCVKETTSFNGIAWKISNPDRQVRNRAHAILRLASHFESPRLRTKQDLQRFYEVLRDIEMRETDQIASELHLAQDRVLHTVRGKAISLHIQEENPDVTIYIPQQADAQQYTFTNSLPKRLFEWIMTDPNTQIRGNISKDGLSAMTAIFVTVRSKITLALQEHGIASIDIDNLDEQALSLPKMPADESTDSEEDTHLPNTPTEQEENDLAMVDTPATSMRSSPDSWRPSVLPPRHPSLIHSREHDTSVDRQYLALLEKVVAQARSQSMTQNGFDMDNLQRSQGNFDQDCTFFLRSGDKFERDCKIGAAGELFVFEVLSNLTHPLPGFSRANWQSNMRKYVKLHPDYASMESWRGSETSDIRYVDSEGVLTDLFIEKGYLLVDMWADRRPDYYIEVKATTSACDTPFYMSKAQYRRMQDTVGGNSNKIYVVFRVYNLGRDSMSLRIYMDPEQLRLNEELDFTAETWSVVPRSEI